MPTTGTPGNVWYPDSTAPVAPLENLFLQQATSVNVALGVLGVFRPSDLTALAALSAATAGQLAQVQEGGAFFLSNGTAWVQQTPANFSTTSARDSAYAKASGAYLVANTRVWVASVLYIYNGTTWTTPLGALSSLPVAMSAGTVASPGGGSSSAPVFYDSSVAVTFPVGRFTQTPIVTAVSDVRATAGVALGCGISTVSTTGFVIRQARLALSPSGFYANWIAVQMTPTSGDG